MTEVPERMLPLYEAKMLNQFDHRDADVVKSATAGKRQNQPRYLTTEEHDDPARLAMPIAWVAESELPDHVGDWLAGFADVTSATNERTVLSALLPRAAVGNTYALVEASDRALLVATLDSFVLDYVARQKVPALHLNFHFVEQFPVPAPRAFAEPNTVWGGPLGSWVRRRVTELIWTAIDMRAAAVELGDAGEPFRWDLERRAMIRAELDAAFFHLYGVVRDDVDYIMETFPIVRRRDEAAHGEYRSKRLILEIYDAMQRAIEAGTEYQTILDPPPGQGPRHLARETT